MNFNDILEKYKEIDKISNYSLFLWLNQELPKIYEVRSL